jgi:hypothetical protein
VLDGDRSLAVESLVLEYASAMTATPAGITDELVTRRDAPPGLTTGQRPALVMYANKA